MKRNLLTLLIVCCSVFFGKAQILQHCFHFLSTGDGLSNSCINYILEDHRGCIWIGTESGANLYDGYTVHQAVIPANFGISDDYVYKIQEDYIGNVWVTYRSGYIVYTDLTTVQIGKEYLKSFGVPLRDNGHIYIDKSGNIWSMDQEFLYYYDLKTGTMESYKSMLNYESPYEGLKVEDYNGMLYICDKKNLWRFDRTGSEGMRWTNIDIPEDLSDPDHKKNMFVSSNGNLWFYSITEEIVYRKKRGLNDYERVVFEQDPNVSNNAVRCIAEDKLGRIWIATNHRGAFLYDQDLNYLKPVKHLEDRHESMISDNIQALMCDHRGTMWVGHFKLGVSFTHPSFSLMINYSGDFKDVSELLLDQDRNLWIGSDGYGLYRERDAKDRVKVQGVPNIVVCNMQEDINDHSIWVSSFGRGLFNVSKDGKVKHYTVENGALIYNNTWYIRQDNQGRIWYLSGWEDLSIFDPQTGKSEVYVDQTGISHRGDYLEYDKESETIYVGGYNDLVAIDKTGVATHLIGNTQGNQEFLNRQVKSLFIDRKNEIWWLGHPNGLSIWDRRTDHIYPMTRESGLCDNIIKSIIQDKDGVVWVSTSNGLMSIEAKRQESTGSLTFLTRTYTTSEGLDVNYFNQAACYTQNDHLLFGSASGFVAIDPANITDDFEKALVPEILECQVSGKRVPMNDLRRLSFRDYQIEISFFTKELIETDCVQFAYMLEGLSDAWIYTRKPHIQFMTLPPGDYRLSIKACGADGVWGPPMSLPISVDAPFYKSWWMKIIYCLIGLILIGLIILYAIRRHHERIRNIKDSMKHEQTVRMSEMKLQFFTNMSHDLRTPLTLIMAPIESLLSEESFSESITAKLKLIHKNANVLYQQVGSLLDFRRLDVGGETLKLHQQDIIGFIQDLCSKFNDYSIDRKIKFTFEHEENRIITQFDTEKFGKILYNLLSNAFKFTPDKGTITVTAKQQDDKLTVEVADTGRGISDEDKKKVFKRFYQTEDSAGVTGSGIGLSIVENYVKMHGGEITVRDNTPCGTTFSFYIPIKVEENAEEEDSNMIIEESGKRQFTLLVVDDNRDLCKFISDSLRDEYNVINAYDGSEAIEVLSTRDVDLVLSDVMMPKVNGLELCERVKTDINFSHIPVILLTAKVSEQSRVEGLKAGADDYITKPFNIEHLRLRIRKFIELSNQRTKDFEQKIEISPSEMTFSSIDEMLLKKALDVVTQHIDDQNFSVEVLGREVGLSRGHLYKKLMSITGHGPQDFIRTIRLKRGKYLLEQGAYQVTEVAYMVGFNSLKTFTENFKQVYGMTPTDYLHTIKNKNN